MANKIVLISNDSNFFEYIKPKLELRKSDELYTFSFANIIEKKHLLKNAVIIVNSENENENTINLLNTFKGTPIIVSAYNENDVFKRKCYRAGMLDFITLLTPDAEFRTRILPALSIASLLIKNEQYRDILVNNKILDKKNEVFVNYDTILDRELKLINSGVKNGIFLAISPDEKSKFLIQSETIESVILNNIRQNDILMNYAPNKYFLLLFDININAAEKLWKKINEQFSIEIFAGITNISNQKKQQLINEVLNKLHTEINNYKKNKEDDSENNISTSKNNNITNFKLFKQEFGKKIENIITPVFYQIQQKYNNKIWGVKITQSTGEGYGNFYIKGKFSTSSFVITSPGFSKINIDITYKKENTIIDTKRISLEPNEFEQGLLEDLLEQFILEYKRGNHD